MERDIFDLQGKVIFIPGGYGGIGEALGWALARRGARIAVAGRSTEKAEDLARSLRDHDLEAVGLQLEATSVDSIRATVDQVADAFGTIDVLINCVGIQREQRIVEVTEEAYDEVIGVNLRSGMFLGQAVAAQQVERGTGGAHIHLLSVRATLGMRDRGYSAYTSSKGGLAMLVKQHALELAPHRITVNGIAPTFIYTPMIHELFKDTDFRDEVVGRVPLGRIPEPADIVGAAVFLATEASAFVTGQVVYVDGGITAGQ